MARYQLTLAYDGTDFFGSQRQAKKRTVQGELEKALRSLRWNGHSILLSSRTDAGVHASGQVASVDLAWSHSDGELAHALNAKLPEDVSVREVRIVKDDFHPRFDAASRTYLYRTFCDPVRHPIRERIAWRITGGIDAKILSNMAKIFPGTHDFSAFGSPTTPKGTTIRTVTKSEWTQVAQGEWWFEVEADAFLYRMVRRLVFVQLAAAQGRVSPEAVAGSLTKPRSTGRQIVLPSGLAPSHGLMLVGVRYQESIG